MSKPPFSRIPWLSLCFYIGMGIFNVSLIIFLSDKLHYLRRTLAAVLLVDLVICFLVVNKTERPSKPLRHSKKYSQTSSRGKK